MVRPTKKLVVVSAVVVAGALLVGIVKMATVRPPTEDSQRDSLRIVGLVPLTGPGASLGEYVRNGMEMACDDIAARFEGKVHIELEIIDSKNNPREAISALEASLAGGDPDAVVCAMSSVARAVTPILQERGITTIVTTTALADLPEESNNVVRVYPTADDFVSPIAAVMVHKHRRIAVLYIHDDFGESNQRVFAELIRKGPARIVAAEPFELTGLDFRPLLARVLSSSPDSVFVTGYGPAYIAVLKQLREADERIPVYSEIGFANPSVLASLGSVAEGIVFDGTDLEMSDSGAPATNSFRTRYKERFGTEPYQVAGFAYDSVQLLAEAAMFGGTCRVPSKADVIGRSPFSGVMGTISFDSAGECRVPLRLMQRRDGKTVLVTTSGDEPANLSRRSQ